MFMYLHIYVYMYMYVYLYVCSLMHLYHTPSFATQLADMHARRQPHNDDARSLSKVAELVPHTQFVNLGKAREHERAASRKRR